ncbi:MAG: cardiolipin synthase [Clostridia bacterium]|nr:cardiolipin synthase [Clostridia bacterium]
MKRTLEYKAGDKTVTRQINYIPVRYIIAIIITVLEVLAVISAVVVCCYFIPYFYIAAWLTEIFCVVKIASSDDPPEYKVPWMLVVLIIPIAGFMLYFMFYSRKLKGKFVKRLGELERYNYGIDTKSAEEQLYKEDPLAASSAKMLTDISGSKLFENTALTYFPNGASYFESVKKDLECAEKFIFLEYFIIEKGRFWDGILEILERKAKAGVKVRVLYDDIGCMSTLPGNYSKELGRLGIDALPFSKLRGNADSEFNNRSHRKILVIDGKIGYTGGINIADEYIGEVLRFGEWKDTGIRLSGDGVKELTRLFLNDYGINAKKLPDDGFDYYPECRAEGGGYVIPFGDGPRPIYEKRVGKSAIKNMLSSATRYVYISTPYLIIDNDLCVSIESAALRGVDVRIIVPHVPDKKMVFGITRSFYKRLIDSGVKIYEFTPGFIHAKNYVADDKYAITGTVNLDYRSLVHHFENGIWMYGCGAVADIKRDLDETIARSEKIEASSLKTNIITRVLRSVIRIFSPML